MPELAARKGALAGLRRPRRRSVPPSAAARLEPVGVGVARQRVVARAARHGLDGLEVRVGDGPLDALLVGQAAATDPAQRARISAQAQQLLAGQHLVVPVVELTTTLGVGPNAHDVAFDASARVQLHDTWKSG